MAEGAWVPAFDSLWTSQKTARVAREMRTSVDVAASKFLRLMVWMRDHTPSGDLGGIDRATVARAIGLATERDKDDVADARGEAFVRALAEASFVSKDARQHVKGWEEGPGRLVNKREEDRLRKEHDRSGHPAPVSACPRCRRSSDGQGANTLGNGVIPGRPPSSVQPKSVGRPMEVRRTETTGTTEQTEQGTPYPRTVDRTATTASPDAVAERQTRALLEATRDPRWRDTLQALLIRGLTGANLCTWFAGTTLEERDGFAIVRAPNGFAVDWLAKHYRPAIASALGTTSTRVVLVRAGEAVDLEPEPVEDETA